MLYEMIQNAQEGKESDMVELILRFSKLIKKYGKKVGYEDAENDLTVDFIEFIHHMDLKKIKNTSDGAIVNFICRSIYRIYLKRLKDEIENKPSVVSIEDLTPVQLQKVNSTMCAELDEPFSMCFPEMRLTSKELLVLKAFYEDMYTIAEIAKILGVSRQNINQTKNRAVNKLRAILFPDMTN